MFKASLFIFEREYILSDYTIESYQPADEEGLPNCRVVFGKIELSYQSVKNDGEFISAAVSSNETVSGYIRVYRRDGFQKFIDYQFANAYVLKFKELFNSVGQTPMTTEIVIGAGIVKRDTMVFENYWNPSNPFEEQAPVTVIEEDEPQFLGYHFEDKNGNEISQTKIKLNEIVTLVIETENGEGDTITIDLDDEDLDYEYKGSVLKNDVLEGVNITGNQTRIELKAVKQN